MCGLCGGSVLQGGYNEEENASGRKRSRVKLPACSSGGITDLNVKADHWVLPLVRLFFSIFFSHLIIIHFRKILFTRLIADHGTSLILSLWNRNGDDFV